MLTPSFVAKNNITHVINCAFPQDSPGWFQRTYRSRYICLGAVDDINANILRWYPAFENVMSRMLREGTGTVFVHCQCGINRSAFLSLTYIAKNFGFEYEEAVKILKRQRPCMFTNSVYMKQTREFVNGCVQSEKDSRVERIGDIDGDTGLSSSGACARDEGNQDKTERTHGLIKSPPATETVT